MAEMCPPVAAADLVADERIAGLMVRYPKQGFGQAHERDALTAGERVFLHQTLDRSGGPFAAQALHQPASEPFRVRLLGGRQRCPGQQRGHAGQFRGPGRGGDPLPQRRPARARARRVGFWNRWV